VSLYVPFSLYDIYDVYGFYIPDLSLRVEKKPLSKEGKKRIGVFH
jgi:hypothetical protein